MTVNLRHWHVGHNRPGYTPDNPDSVATCHTALDALRYLLDDVEAEKDYLTDNGDTAHAEDASQVCDLLDQCQYFFDGDGNVYWDSVPDRSQYAATLAALDGDLTYVVGNTALWARSCMENCAE